MGAVVGAVVGSVVGAVVGVVGAVVGAVVGVVVGAVVGVVVGTVVTTVGDTVCVGVWVSGETVSKVFGSLSAVTVSTGSEAVVSEAEDSRGIVLLTG